MTKRIQITGYLISAALGFAAAYLLIGQQNRQGESLPTLQPQTNALQKTSEFRVNSVKADTNSSVTVDSQITELANVGLKNVDVEKMVSQILAQKGRFNRLAMAYPIALAATTKQLVAFINALEGQSGNPDSQVVIRLFYQRYLRLDTNKAMQLYWANNSFDGQNLRMGQFDMKLQTLFALYHEWALSDMQAVLVDIEQSIPNKRNELDMFLYRLVTDAHFSQDITLLAYIQSNPELKRMLAYNNPKAKDESFEQAFARILADDSDRNIQRTQLMMLVSQWAESDPQAAMQAMLQLKAGDNRERLINTVFRAWANDDVEMALAYAMNMEPKGKYGMVVLSNFAYESPQKALLLYEQHKGSLGVDTKKSIIRAWSAADPRAVAQYYEQNQGPDFKKDVKSLLYGYSNKYPEEAFLWAQRMGLLEDSDIARLTGVAMVRADVKKAQSLFEQMAPGTSKAGLFGQIVDQLSRNDINQARQWLAEHEGEPGYAMAQSRLYLQWSRTDPRAAAEQALALNDSGQHNGNISTAVKGWYQQSPEQALGWAYELSQGSTRDFVLGNLATATSRRDVKKAREIASNISSDTYRETILARFKGQ